METRIITLKDITSAFGMADYVAFTLKEDFDNRHIIPNYDPIVMYVKRRGEDPDYWYDQAHIAETLAPKSLWEINDEEMVEQLKWLDYEHSLRQLDIILSGYAEVLDWAKDHPGESLPDAFTTRHPMPKRFISEVMPISDNHIAIYLDPREGEESKWIAHQLMDMANSEPVSTCHLNVRTEAGKFCRMMITLAYQKGYEHFFDIMPKVAKSPLYFKDQQNMTLEQIVDSIREICLKMHCLRGYIENTRNISPEWENDTNKYLTLLQTLRPLAKELGLKIFLTSNDIELCL